MENRLLYIKSVFKLQINERDDREREREGERVKRRASIQN